MDRHRHFEPKPASVRAARALVADVLKASHYPGDADTVLLLVSEVVTNAVRHAATPFDLTVTVHHAEVTVSVVDHDRVHPPKMGNPAPDATSGRGLRIIDQLATDWGSESLGGDSKRVWFRCS